jgi:hypothetical protein
MPEHPNGRYTLFMEKRDKPGHRQLYGWPTAPGGLVKTPQLVGPPPKSRRYDTPDEVITYIKRWHYLDKYHCWIFDLQNNKAFCEYIDVAAGKTPAPHPCPYPVTGAGAGGTGQVFKTSPAIAAMQQGTVSANEVRKAAFDPEWPQYGKKQRGPHQCKCSREQLLRFGCNCNGL